MFWAGLNLDFTLKSPQEILKYQCPGPSSEIQIQLAWGGVPDIISIFEKHPQGDSRLNPEE